LTFTIISAQIMTEVAAIVVVAIVMVAAVAAVPSGGVITGGGGSVEGEWSVVEGVEGGRCVLEKVEVTGWENGGPVLEVAWKETP
jgi:hypothetical protein